MLEDVENNRESDIELEIVRLFGRRASDRRYNMALFQNKVIYSIGPNIVIQTLE